MGRSNFHNAVIFDCSADKFYRGHQATWPPGPEPWGLTLLVAMCLEVGGEEAGGRSEYLSVVAKVRAGTAATRRASVSLSPALFSRREYLSSPNGAAPYQPRAERSAALGWIAKGNPALKGRAMGGAATGEWIAPSGLCCSSIANPGRCPGLVWQRPVGAKRIPAGGEGEGGHGVDCTNFPKD